MTQVQNLITDHLDTWTQAIETKSSAGRGSSNKFTLVGIKKLRELILEMAVRGLLAAQDPNDEPAKILLEKIAAEKAQLIKDGKIKKTKALPEIKDAEKPFDLPVGWFWLRLPDSYYTISPSGKKLKTSEILEEGDFPVVDQGQQYVSGYFNDENLVIKIPKPVIIFGDHTKNLKLVDFDFIAGADGTKILCPFVINEEYFYQYLTSLDIDNRGYGRHFKILNDNLIAIPPLNEQVQIVAKVGELMALCDQLEQQTLNSIEAHQTLVETLLNELVNPNNTANIDQAWSLIAGNFDVLFSSEKSIDTLKQTILQLAVMGKLVPQNPNDNPASKLLEKIATEKAQLIKDKKIKKTKPLPEITEEEKPFDLPDGWEWVRLGDLFLKIESGGTPSKIQSDYWGGSIPWASVKDLNVDTFINTTQDFITDKGLDNGSRLANQGDILICTRMGLGKIAIVQKPMAFNQDLKSIALPVQVDSYFFINSYKTLKIKGTGTTVAGIKQEQLLNYVFGLPPLKEQKRIVAKVDELMTLCDQLKNQLQTTQQTQTHLAESIAQETLK